MTDTRALLRRTAELAADFLDSLDDRPVFPQVSPEELRAALRVSLQDESLGIRQLARLAQDLFRNRELAEIMERARETRQLDLLRVQSETRV